MEKIKEIESFIKEHNNKAKFFLILSMISKSYAFSPVLMFLYFFGINFFLCIGMTILYAAIFRILYVTFKHKMYLNLCLKKLFEVCKENELNTTFK